MESKIHPAVTVSNIKNFIPVTLEMESVHFSSWSELFKIHCKAFLVYDHLLPRVIPDPKPDKPENSDTPKPGPHAVDEWERLDSIVLQWIYGTISSDLLHTIMQPNNTAHAAWQTLTDIFHDNQTTRALQLTSKLSQTRIDNFPNASAYCQELKSISD
ncbi:uncharacterized protein LOC143636911 [Bidens hawaiensis]|uniref:uncharacterized protein LOC143636911 n=1 Tax=Bidens hawaiensis TaxID=980011 RepID=UPI00404A2862